VTTLIRGRTGPLLVEWFEYAGGPPAVVNNVIITITPLSGGPAVVGPTSTGVTNPATGVNVYQWAVPPGLPLGDYLVVWDGEDTGMSPIQASEVVSVVASSAGSVSGPCSTWTPIWCCDLLDTAAVTGTALQAATEVLWALSGRQFDSCNVEIWPCRRECMTDLPGGWNSWTGGTWTYPQPALIAGTWFNLTCGSCVGECSCTALSQVELPMPVLNVIEVRMDGVALIPNVDYRLDDGRFLTRLGGEDWPWCNDLSQLEGEGTWSVTLTIGKDVPVMGQMAVGELACEFAKACLGDDECRLPKTVQQLTRQGVSLTFIDPNQLFENGLTGLYFADLFINAVNPKRNMAPAKVYNLDEPGAPRLGS
jgi:hypothetical protein